MKPFISVLIPAYNEAALLPRALQAVNTAMERSDVSYEVVVCDNNSTDATARIAQRFGARVVFETHNQIARARNRAAREARGEWLIFIDADAAPTAALIAKTIEVMRTPGLCAGGAHIGFDGPRAFLKDLPAAFWNKISSAMHWMAGSYIFCRADAWEEVGGFDERYYAAEEIIFSKRLKKWAKAHGQKLRVITEEKIISSSRKFEMYSVLQLAGFFILSGIPGAWRNKALCRLWYRR